MTDIDPELIQLQKAADEAHQRVREVQERFGRPTQEGGWSDEQHAEWQAAWDAWFEASVAIRTRATAGVEMAVKKAVRHPEPETEAA